AVRREDGLPAGRRRGAGGSRGRGEETGARLVVDGYLEGVPGEPGRDLLGQLDAGERHSERHRLAPTTHHALAERGRRLAGDDRGPGLAGAARARARDAPRAEPGEAACARVADPGVVTVGGERVERVARAR